MTDLGERPERRDDDDMSYDEAVAALTAARALVARADTNPRGVELTLTGRDVAVLAGYERAKRAGWLDDDRARHAAGLLRSAIGVLEYLRVRLDAEHDPDRTIAWLLERLKRPNPFSDEREDF